ncbi:thiopurine S-methyltransferase [Hoeflea prorocentri]|uniref:Thiopurine S-methyltransferase n=1 Tax=Hoeflea prorocentri TaxID=1922333 RepID=A0A9X3UN85_9HYPH|nr:thiopurine S-methyltransferase [Hoeflea prorocentri]MCY6383495.1 thiopurine S-methyltransferase [Hoeflea prorocentri]MDA5401295.1 thiopurine S-methyltransferase [Hoeflea prorocentri]
MDEDFWQARWRDNRIGFHEAEPNSLLSSHYARLKLEPGSRVFVPLCGKAVDLDWFVGNGHHVIGVEFNQRAVEEVFERNGLSPQVRMVGQHRHYSAAALDLFAGDFFGLTPDMIGSVDAVYDRAALIALPVSLRRRYVRHLFEITNFARQFLITLDYDQTQMDGPPFSVPADEIDVLYGGRYRTELLESREMTGPISKRCGGSENAWLIEPA